MSKRWIMYKSEQCLQASVALNEQSLTIIRKSAIDLDEWINEALAVYQEEKLAYLHDVFAKRSLPSFFIAPEDQSLENRVRLFFKEKNGDLTAFFSFALNIGYARADRLVNTLLTQSVINRGGGKHIKYKVQR